MVQQGAVTVAQQNPVSLIDDELTRALQGLLDRPQAVVDDHSDVFYHTPQVSAERVEARKLAAAMESSMEADNAEDLEMQMAIEESMMEEALRLSMEEADFMCD